MVFRIVDSALNPAAPGNENTLQDGFFLFLVKATELGKSNVASTFKDFWSKTESAGDTSIALGFAKPGDRELPKIDSSANEGFSKEALGDSLSRVAIVGSSAFAEEIMKWVLDRNKMVSENKKISSEKFHQADNPSRKIVVFSIHAKFAGSNEISSLADKIINELYFGNRPVRRFKTSFFAAFDDVDGKAGKALEKSVRSGSVISKGAKSLGQSARTVEQYFLPELKDRIVGETGSGSVYAVRTYAVSDLEGMSIDVELGKYKSQRLSATVQDVRLHTNEHTAILEWSIVSGPEISNEIRAGKFIDERDEAVEKRRPIRALPDLEKGALSLWMQLVLDPGERFCLAHCLDLNAEGRFSYYTYNDSSRDANGVLVPKQISLKDRKGMELAETRYFNPDYKSEKADIYAEIQKERAVLLVLLKKFVDRNLAGELLAGQFTDNRARVFSSIVVEGAPPETATGIANQRIVEDRLLQVDPFETYPMYNPEKSKLDRDASIYDRFAPSTKFFVTDHSFIMLGFTNTARPPTNWPGRENAQPPELPFVESPVHHSHMPDIYRRMFLFFLFKESVLRSISSALIRFEDGLKPTKPDLTDKEVEQIESLRRRLIMAASNFNQIELSSQLQGRELAMLMDRQFRLRQSWDALDRKITALEEHIRIARSSRDQRLKNALENGGLAFAVVLFILAVEGANFQSVRDPGLDIVSPTSLSWLFCPVQYLNDILANTKLLTGWGLIGSVVAQLLAFAVVALVYFTILKWALIPSLVRLSRLKSPLLKLFRRE